jgi:hypothetical protein
MKTNNNTYKNCRLEKDVTVPSSESRRLDALSFIEKLRLEAAKIFRDINNTILPSFTYSLIKVRSRAVKHN